jgi:hypothetical protein
MRELQKLSLAGLSEIYGGRLAIAFEQALKRVAQDCEDRPGERKARSVSVTLNVVPVLDEDGLCDNVKLQAQISDNVPKRRSKIYDLSLRKGGHLLFHPDSLENVDQHTLDFDRGEE